MVHYDTVYDPAAPLADNRELKVNLFEFSKYHTMNTLIPENFNRLKQKITFLFNRLCNYDKTLISSLASWMWNELNGKPQLTALIFSGDQGTGKSTLGFLMYQLVPKRLRTLARAQHLSRFNGTMKDRSFVWFEEFDGNLSETQLNSLKSLVSDEVVSFEGKGTNCQTCQNISSLWITTNAEIPYLNGRRYCHIRTTARPFDSPEQEQEFKDFCALCQDPQRNGEVLEALYKCLKEHAATIGFATVNNTIFPSEYLIETKSVSSLPAIKFSDSVGEFLSDKLQDKYIEMVRTPAGVACDTRLMFNTAALSAEFHKYVTNEKRHNSSVEATGTTGAIKKQFVEYCVNTLMMVPYKNSDDRLRIESYELELNLKVTLGENKELKSYCALLEYVANQSDKLRVFQGFPTAVACNEAPQFQAFPTAVACNAAPQFQAFPTAVACNEAPQFQMSFPPPPFCNGTFFTPSSFNMEADFSALEL